MAIAPGRWPRRCTSHEAPDRRAFRRSVPGSARRQAPGTVRRSKAVILPISPTAETGRAGILIVGLNPFRLFDESYRGFLGLAAGQIAAALANAASL